MERRPHPAFIRTIYGQTQAEFLKKEEIEVLLQSCWCSCSRLQTLTWIITVYCLDLDTTTLQIRP
jgi:hypothetical protein